MKTKLNRIGKRCFELCYHVFDQNMRGISSDEDAIERIMGIMNCSEAGAKIRLNYAKQIFRDGDHKEALDLAKGRTR